MFCKKGVLLATHREKAPSNKTPNTCEKYEHGHWIVGKSNQMIGPFCTPYSICLVIGSDRAVLCRNAVLSILVI